MLVIAADETVEVRTETCALTFAGVAPGALAAVLKARALPILTELLKDLGPDAPADRSLPGAALEQRLRAAGLID